MLREYIDEKSIAQSSWARKSGINRRTIAKYFKKSTIQVDTLFTICQTLGFNFIREIADALPDHLPPTKAIDESAKVAELEKQVAELTNEVATLKEVLKLVGGR